MLTCLHGSKWVPFCRCNSMRHVLALIRQLRHVQLVQSLNCSRLCPLLQLYDLLLAVTSDLRESRIATKHDGNCVRRS